MINCWNLNPGGLLLYNATLSKWLIWMVHWNKRAFFLGINVNYVIVVSSNDDIILYLLNLTSHFISLRYPVSYSWPVRVCVWSAPVTSPGRGPYIFTCDVWETLYAFDRCGGTLYIYLCHEVFFSWTYNLGAGCLVMWLPLVGQEVLSGQFCPCLLCNTVRSIFWQDLGRYT